MEHLYMSFYLIFLHLLTELFHKDFFSLVRIYIALIHTEVVHKEFLLVMWMKLFNSNVECDSTHLVL